MNIIGNGYVGRYADKSCYCLRWSELSEEPARSDRYPCSHLKLRTPRPQWASDLSRFSLPAFGPPVAAERNEEIQVTGEELGSLNLSSQRL